jgi:hypothetical protein
MQDGGVYMTNQTCDQPEFLSQLSGLWEVEHSRDLHSLLYGPDLKLGCIWQFAVLPSLENEWVELALGTVKKIRD